MATYLLPLFSFASQYSASKHSNRIRLFSTLQRIIDKTHLVQNNESSHLGCSCCYLAFNWQIDIVDPTTTSETDVSCTKNRLILYKQMRHQRQYTASTRMCTSHSRTFYFQQPLFNKVHVVGTNKSPGIVWSLLHHACYEQMEVLHSTMTY